MAVLTQELNTIRDDASSVSFKKRSFERELRDLIENPCDKNLDRINFIRGLFAQLTRDTADITSRIQSLTWKLTKPEEDVLRSLNEVIALSRHLYAGSMSAILSHKPLWERDVIKSEIEEFNEVNEHLLEVVDDIEMTYFTLPGTPGFDDLTRELESL